MNNDDNVASSRKIGCRTSSMNAFAAMVMNCLISQVARGMIRTNRHLAIPVRLLKT